MKRRLICPASVLQTLEREGKYVCVYSLIHTWEIVVGFHNQNLTEIYQNKHTQLRFNFGPKSWTFPTRISVSFLVLTLHPLRFSKGFWLHFGCQFWKCEWSLTHSLSRFEIFPHCRYASVLGQNQDCVITIVYKAFPIWRSCILFPWILISLVPLSVPLIWWNFLNFEF